MGNKLGLPYLAWVPSFWASLDPIIGIHFLREKKNDKKETHSVYSVNFLLNIVKLECKVLGFVLILILKH